MQGGKLEYLIVRNHLIGHAWLTGARTKAKVDERFRWTVQDEFAADAYQRLVLGRPTAPEADAGA